MSEKKKIEKYHDCQYGKGFCFDCDMYNGIIFTKEIREKRSDCTNYRSPETKDFFTSYYEEKEDICKLCHWSKGMTLICLDCESHLSNIIKRIHFLLGNDSKTAEEITIISKAFNMTPGAFLKYVVDKEIDYAKHLLEMSNPKAELESYYEFEINFDELKKLILIEEVL